MNLNLILLNFVILSVIVFLAGCNSFDNMKVLFEKSQPKIRLTGISSVTIASNNSVITKAKVGETVTITFNSDEDLLTPTVTILGSSASVSGGPKNWTASYTLVSGDPEGPVSFNISNLKNLSGKTYPDITSVTDTSVVYFDKTPPSLSPVTISSNNSKSTTRAKVGDRITLSFISNENLMTTPTVTIFGNSASVSGGPTSWTATYFCGPGDPEGTVGFAISGLSDLTGNTAPVVSSITAGSNVTFDRTAPTLSPVTISSNYYNSSYAYPGNTITLSFTSSESIVTPTVTMKGTPVAVTGGPTVWSADYVVNSGESSAYIIFNISNLLDLTGNTSSNVSSTTDSTSVLFENYDLEWANKKTITLNADSLSMGSSLTGYPMLLRLNSANFPEISTNTEPGGADIRFSQTNGVPLHYEIENWADGTSGIIWVRIESVSQSVPTVIWMYYDNPGVLTNLSTSAYTFDKNKNFQGVWHLGETSGSTANESTANNFDGTLAGNTVSNTGIIGNGMRFDGSGDYIDTGRFASEFSIDGAKPKTASIWVYTENMGNRGGPFDIGACAIYQQFGFRPFFTDIWRAQFWGGDIDFAYTSMSRWVHLALAYDGATIHIYADGNEVTNAPLALNTGNVNPMRIGVYIQGATFYSFTGVLDEMRLSNTYRSADWMRLDYETQKAGSTLVVVGP